MWQISKAALVDLTSVKKEDGKCSIFYLAHQQIPKWNLTQNQNMYRSVPSCNMENVQKCIRNVFVSEWFVLLTIPIKYSCPPLLPSFQRKKAVMGGRVVAWPQNRGCVHPSVQGKRQTLESHEAVTQNQRGDFRALFDKPARVLLLCFVIHDHTWQEHKSHIPPGLTPQKTAGTRTYECTRVEEQPTSNLFCREVLWHWAAKVPLRQFRGWALTALTAGRAVREVSSSAPCPLGQIRGRI